LRHCLLEVSIGGDKRICRLSAPTEMDALKLAQLQSGAQSIDLPELDAMMLAGTNSLKLDLAPVEIPAPFEKLPKNEPLKIDGEQRILIKGSSHEEGPRIELTVRFVADPQRSARRVILVSAKATHKAAGVSEEDAMKALGGPLDAKRIAAGVREYTDNVARLELNVKREKSRLEDFNKNAEREANRFDLMFKSLRGQIAVLDGPSKEEKKRELDNAQKQLTNFERQRDEQRAKLHDNVTQETEKQDKAKATVAQFESVGKLMADTAARGRLEFRVYFQIGGELVELYRSKSFPQDL